MRNALAAAAFAAAMAATGAWAQAADSGQPVTCVKRDGEMPGPFVPTPEVAKKIYTAIAAAITPWDMKKYPIVVVTDDGDQWSVSQTRHYPKRKSPAVVRIGGKTTETVEISAGGGMLDMRIDKCSGAITYAALDR